MIELIAFDADDTLWHNEPFYQESKEKLKGLLSSSLDPKLVADTLDRVEIRNIEYFGYGIKSFVLSMIEAAIQVTNGQIKGTEIEKIIGFAKDMLQFNLQLFDGVEAVLSELSSAHDLMLITKGDQFEQERKIARSGLGGYFKYIEIVGEKSPSSYIRLLGKYGLSPENFLMIGNSLKSDILPVLDIGGQAIYIPYHSTWTHEHLEAEVVARYHYNEVEYIGQIPEFVRNIA
jgi:putative hydrolase of the HAD superfamily